MTRRVAIACFSPTNTTRTVCDAIALGMGSQSPRVLDLTDPACREGLRADPARETAGVDYLIVGAPVYTGKLPQPVLDSLQVMKVHGLRCSTVVVYGNRDYGVAWRRMVEILSANGFDVVSAGAFIGQHSYSDVIPVAMGRPDAADIEQAIAFGEKSATASAVVGPDDVPVQLDVFSRSEKYMPLRPVFDSEACALCGVCAERCPLGALSPETGTWRSPAAEEQCLGCMACVAACDYEARAARPDLMMRLAIKLVLRRAAKERQEPLTIFGAAGPGTEGVASPPSQA